MARSQNLQRRQRKELLNDVLIYITAAQAGLPVLAKLAAATGGWAWSPVLLIAAALTGNAMALVLRRLERRRG